jgi:hypothetical protein
MIAVLVGLVFVVLGIWGVAHWFADFLTMVRGLVPVSLALGGIVSMVVGFSSLQPRRRSSSEEK